MIPMPILAFCTFCRDHDPATLEPLGKQCGRSAVEEIHWQDGRISNACRAHGLGALDADARALVVKVVKL